MNVEIRAVGEQDLEAVHAILTSPPVVRNSMQVPHSSIERTRKRLSPGAGTYQLVAVAGEQVVGFGELVTYPEEPRYKHAGDIEMVAVDAEWGGKGIGTALMKAMLDLADNWLALSRLGLIVFTENAHAIGLYERLGFEIEGTLRRLGFGDGAWIDAYMMSRILVS